MNIEIPLQVVNRYCAKAWSISIGKNEWMVSESSNFS